MSMTLQKIKMILQIWLNHLRCVQHTSFRMGTKFFIGNDNYQRYLSCLSNLTFKMSLLVSMCVCVFVWGLFLNVCVDVSVIYRYPSSKTYIMCMHKMLTKRRHTSGVEHAKQNPQQQRQRMLMNGLI